MITCCAGGSTKVKEFIAWFMATPLTNAQSWWLWILFLFVFLYLPSSWLFWAFPPFLYFLCLIDLNIPNICYNLSAVQGALSTAVLLLTAGQHPGNTWEQLTSIPKSQVSSASLCGSADLPTQLTSSPKWHSIIKFYVFLNSYGN